MRLLISFLVLLFASAAQAELDAWQTLSKTALAARELNYKGVFVYQNRASTRSVEVYHRNADGRELTRNVVLTGQQHREVFAEGKDIVIFSPKQDKVVIEKRRGQNLFPAMLPQDLSLVKSNYDAHFSVADLVAGRAAKTIELLPKDSFRYNYKIWVDAEFGLTLKMAMFDSQKQLLEQIWFNDLSMLNTHNLDWYQPKIDANKQYVMEDETAQTHVKSNFVVMDLPPGYHKVDHIERSVQGKPHPVNQLIFTDGIASVSMFVEPLHKGARPRVGNAEMGNAHVCADVVEGHQVIVMGEVPERTVQQILKSVSFKK